MNIGLHKVHRHVLLKKCSNLQQLPFTQCLGKEWCRNHSNSWIYELYDIFLIVNLSIHPKVEEGICKSSAIVVTGMGTGCYDCSSCHISKCLVKQCSAGQTWVLAACYILVCLPDIWGVCIWILEVKTGTPGLQGQPGLHGTPSQIKADRRPHLKPTHSWFWNCLMLFVNIFLTTHGFLPISGSTVKNCLVGLVGGGD